MQKIHQKEGQFTNCPYRDLTIALLDGTLFYLAGFAPGA